MKGADILPFRWDLVAPDQLGTLLAGTQSPRLWFVDDLAACAGKVLARSGNGDLVFVGRSLDSMFDLLSGALAGIADGRRLYRLPVSFSRTCIPSARRWRARPLTGAHTYLPPRMRSCSDRIARETGREPERGGQR